MSHHIIFWGGLGNQMNIYVNCLTKYKVFSYQYISVNTPREFGLDWFDIKIKPINSRTAGYELIKNAFIKINLKDLLFINNVVKPIMLTEFVPRNPLTKPELWFAEQIKNKTVLHIRRTDFNREDYRIKSMDFYKDMKFDNNTVIISDDEIWCRNNLSHIGKTIPTKHLHPAAIMYACKNAKTVIHNPISTFGVWCYLFSIIK